jgi:Spy/CpxP family protein refolding chaperone
VGSLALAAVAVAGPRGGGAMERISEMAEEIGLDQAQVDEIDSILSQSRQEGKAIREQLREARGEMKSLMEADAPDERAVMAHIEEVGELKVELKKLKVGAMLDVRGIMTPEQFAEFKEIRKQKRSDRQQGDGPPRRRGPRGGF